MPSMTAENLKMENLLQAAALRRSLNNPALAGGAGEDLAQVVAVLERFDTAIDAAGRDDLLSPLGRADAGMKAGRVAYAQLDAFTSKTIGGIELRRAAVEAGILPEPKASKDVAAAVVGELRAAEIRAQFRSLDPLEREAIYAGEIDPEVRAALESAPPTVFRARPGDLPGLVPFIDPERVREQRAARAEARDPEKAAELRDLEMLTRVYRGAVASARQSILEVAPGLRAATTPILTR